MKKGILLAVGILFSIFGKAASDTLSNGNAAQDRKTIIFGIVALIVLIFILVWMRRSKR